LKFGNAGKKAAWNQFVGTLMIEHDFRFRVFTGSEDLVIPFEGRILRKPAPGGFDHCARQAVVSLISKRPIYQTILDMELLEVAQMILKFSSFSRAVVQARVDGVVACLPKRARAQALELARETWPCGVTKYKVEEIGPDHHTLIPRSHVFSPLCEEGEAPEELGQWEEQFQEAAVAWILAGGSCLIRGQGGTGKTTLVSETLGKTSGKRVILTGKNHVCVNNLTGDGEK